MQFTIISTVGAWTLTRIRDIRLLIGQSAWAPIGVLLSVVTGILSVKIVAILVEPSQYGIASLILGVTALINNLTAGPFGNAHLRIYFDYRAVGYADWFRKRIRVGVLFIGLLGAALYLAVGTAYSLAGVGLYLALATPACLLLVVQPWFSVFVNYLEAEKQYSRLAIASSGQKLAVLLWTYVLVAVSSGAAAVVMGQVAGAATALVLALGSVSGAVKSSAIKMGASKPLRLLPKFRQFGWSLPLGYVLHWVLSTSDRYLLQHVKGPLDVGRYALNYSLYSIPFLMMNGWLDLVTRPAVFSVAAEDNYRRVYELVMQRLTATLLGCGVVTISLMVAQPVIHALLLSERYRVNWDIPLAIALGHSCLVAGYAVVPVYYAERKVASIAKATAIAAVVNVTLNLLFIPIAGIRAAAWATFVAYAVWAACLIIHVLAKRRALVCLSND